MGVNVANLLMGPATLYVASYGAAEPADGTWTALDPTVWRDGGSTNGGLKLSVTPTFKEIEVDQVPDAVGVRMTGRSLAVETEMSEPTLLNIQSLMNGGTVAAGGGSSIGTVTIVAATGVMTVSVAHSLNVGDPVVLGAITSTTGVTAGVVYYVLTVPSSTTLTLSATPGGSPLTLTTNGSSASITKATWEAFTPLSTVSAFQPTYSALCIEGTPPGTNASFLRRVYIRRVLSSGGFDVEWKKDAQQGLKVKWGAYFVSNSIAPFRVVDQKS